MISPITLDCKHGKFTFFPKDEYIGRSLELYGEYSDDENTVFNMCLGPGHTAIEIGSNIGVLTVPMAKLVGPTGKVYAFEPQPQNFILLKENLSNNNLNNVEALQVALSDTVKETTIPSLEKLGHYNYGQAMLGEGDIPITTKRLDDYHFDKIRFIKIDAEGSELEILKGAEETIKKHRPMLYVENDREFQSADLIGWLADHKYRMWWHRPSMFYTINYRKEKKNVFGNMISQNMFCASEESGIEVGNLEEVADIRIGPDMYDRELARTLRISELYPTDLENKMRVTHWANLSGDTKLARKTIKEGLKVDPDNLSIRVIQGLLDLQDGDFKKGWPAYELRYEHHGEIGRRFGFRKHDVPHWDGSPTDKVVLIWCEQGFGDTLMFVRFMHNVLQRAPNAILEVQPQLFELIENSKIVAPDKLFRMHRTLPEYAYHCSIPSLPATLGLTKESELLEQPRYHINGRTSYLIADDKMIQSWVKRAEVPKMGICLRGGFVSERAYSRDVPEEAIVDFTHKYGPFTAVSNEGQWESFSDTAAAMSAMDLVLTVDTSAAHLAGALGVPVWLMLSSDPDFRWQKHRSDSPWYPSMRIFRQKKFMDWSNVIEEMSMEFDKLKLKAA